MEVVRGTVSLSSCRHFSSFPGRLLLYIIVRSGQHRSVSIDDALGLCSSSSIPFRSSGVADPSTGLPQRNLGRTDSINGPQPLTLL